MISNKTINFITNILVFSFSISLIIISILIWVNTKNLIILRIVIVKNMLTVKYNYSLFTGEDVCQKIAKFCKSDNSIKDIWEVYKL